jgi:hypothetical protein
MDTAGGRAAGSLPRSAKTSSTQWRRHCSDPGNASQRRSPRTGPAHKAIIEDCGYTHAGVGLVYPGGTEWYSTVDFAAH